jgi:hypothetical protein
MKTHRYNQIIMPLDRYLNRLTPAAKRLVGLLERACMSPALTAA